MQQKNRSFGTVLNKIERLSAYGAGAIAVFMMLLITTDVFLRSVFNNPIPGVFELVGFLFVSAVALGFPYVQSMKENISIDFVTRYFPPSLQKTCIIFGYTIALLAVALIAWQSGAQAYKSFQIQDYTIGIVRFPLWPAKSILFFGLSLLFIRLIYDFTSLIRDQEFKSENY